ncbi:HAD family hydrolase [Salinithrix halophila]|uniref:HAD family hydrolase n=1 Tax=Salinithrix halophila TaxID=1485204 RepID=A0ABV8JGB3_9BACL
MTRVICFDLDGTLLPMDTEVFIVQYLKELTPHMAHIIPPDKLVDLILDATLAMIDSEDGNVTNEEIFARRFLARSGLKREEIWPLFDRFYEEHFSGLQKYVHEAPISRQVVEAALDRGFRVAVATNPVFPKAAIRERMRWAGVDDLVEWVSVYEETHWCKPRPEYYREVAQAMGVDTEACIMVGNDMQEDMVASTVGMKTYFVKDCRIDRGEPAYRPDQEGTLAELLEDLKDGKGIFAPIKVG